MSYVFAVALIGAAVLAARKPVRYPWWVRWEELKGEDQ